MEKFEKAEIKIVEFDTEDVITASGGINTEDDPLN